MLSLIEMKVEFKRRGGLVATTIALERSLVAVVAEVDLIEGSVREAQHAMLASIGHRGC